MEVLREEAPTPDGPRTGVWDRPGRHGVGVPALGVFLGETGYAL